MAGWRIHEGPAVALPAENIDTDQLIPARFMSTSRADGYGGYLLYDQRRDENGKARPDMPLNRYPEASILIAGRNFGSGSSREAAVYALVDFGIRSVVAPSFGDIFAANAVNNALLPARVTAQDCSALIAMLDGEAKGARIDLERCELTIAGLAVAFDLDPVGRTKLMRGWDDIDLTASYAKQIDAFRDTRRAAHPWAWPRQ